MNASDDQLAVTDATQLLAQCRTRLDDLNRAVKRQQWQEAAVIAADYAAMLAMLGEIGTPASVAEEIVQLDIRHRRCMRTLSRQMAAVTEDIASLEAGEKAARRSRDLVTTIYHQ
ncbi:hypothetical protein [Mariprofundus ferrooxydans]|uniref:Flagellar protein FliT n=1 Tax=Mariprofundus ferrooxydans PV-1 TaxID=314345 RepID=Q0F274_9PROT|nr:hypothetical protein [Mariprofundus ferrooxydans]EAU55676.1 hypothetical protein SPV1_01972 [Mariprofundus ferrooxydans PV-1]KON48596.1 hypothetical protein AL013_01070 [Mariprofundus ferrooxydans]